MRLKTKTLLTAVILIILTIATATSVSAEVLVDSFEDGDYTNNPEWTYSDNGYSGYMEVNEQLATDGTFSVETYNDGGSQGKSVEITRNFGTGYFKEGTIFKADIREEINADTSANYFLTDSNNNNYIIGKNDIPSNEWVSAYWYLNEDNINMTVYNNDNNIVHTETQSYNGASSIQSFSYGSRDSVPGSTNAYSYLDNVRHTGSRFFQNSEQLVTPNINNPTDYASDDPENTEDKHMRISYLDVHNRPDGETATVGDSDDPSYEDDGYIQMSETDSANYPDYDYYVRDFLDFRNSGSYVLQTITDYSNGSSDVHTGDPFNITNNPPVIEQIYPVEGEVGTEQYISSVVDYPDNHNKARSFFELYAPNGSFIDSYNGTTNNIGEEFFQFTPSEIGNYSIIHYLWDDAGGDNMTSETVQFEATPADPIEISNPELETATDEYRLGIDIDNYNPNNDGSIQYTINGVNNNYFTQGIMDDLTGVLNKDYYTQFLESPTGNYSYEIQVYDTSNDLDVTYNGTYEHTTDIISSISVPPDLENGNNLTKNRNYETEYEWRNWLEDSDADSIRIIKEATIAGTSTTESIERTTERNMPNHAEDGSYIEGFNYATLPPEFTNETLETNITLQFYDGGDNDVLHSKTRTFTNTLKEESGDTGVFATALNFVLDGFISTVSTLLDSLDSLANQAATTLSNLYQEAGDAINYITCEQTDDSDCIVDDSVDFLLPIITFIMRVVAIAINFFTYFLSTLLMILEYAWAFYVNYFLGIGLVTEDGKQFDNLENTSMNVVDVMDGDINITYEETITEYWARTGEDLDSAVLNANTTTIYEIEQVGNHTPDEPVVVEYLTNPYEIPDGYPVGTMTVVNLVNTIFTFIAMITPAFVSKPILFMLQTGAESINMAIDVAELFTTLLLESYRLANEYGKYIIYGIIGIKALDYYGKFQEYMNDKINFGTFVGYVYNDLMSEYERVLTLGVATLNYLSTTATFAVHVYRVIHSIIMGIIRTIRG